VLQVCQPSGQPPAVVCAYIYILYLYVWSKQGLFNCYLTIIYIYICLIILYICNILLCIYKHTHAHIILYIMVHVHEKDKVWSRVGIGYSVVVSRWANTLAATTAVSLIRFARGVSSPPSFFYISITITQTYIYICIFIVLWLHTRPIW